MRLIPSHIATLATRAAINDLRTMLKSLEFWNPRSVPTVYIFCDAAVKAAIPSFAYTGDIITNETLNAYTDLNRAAMERLPGVQYKNLFFDFVCEKLRLLEWVFTTTDTSGVLFCDADICFMGPLFSIPVTADIAVSPHKIREQDEARFGVYNAGMIWLRNKDIVSIWREECGTSHFYEQAAIEGVVKRVDNVYEIPVSENYGWWRLWQGRKPAHELQKEWGIHRAMGGCGITVHGRPLGSVHTHFGEKIDDATVQYNEWVLSILRRIAKAHEPTRRFLIHLGFDTRR